MRRSVPWLILFALLLLVLGPSCAPSTQAATLRLRCTAPALSNDGTCTLRVLAPLAPATLVTVHFQATGPFAFEDSILTVAGAPVTDTRTVPPGLYTVRAWASDSGGVSCDTTVTARVWAAPAPVQLIP